jgi:DNA polymerase-3 subunit delta'
MVVSHMPGRFLPTIRSRCRGLRLPPLGEADFTKVVARVMAWGQSQIDPAVMAELFRLSEGSPGKALRLAEEGGLELYHELLTLLSSLLPGEAGRRAGADTAALHTLADRVAGKKGEATYRTLADLLSSWICRLIRLGAGQTGGGADESPVMQRFLAAASLDQWLDVWDNQQALFAQTDRLNLDRRQAILNAFFSLEKTIRT